MHLIDQPTAAPGNQFTDGNAALGIPSTIVDAKFLNAIQNELANFITSRGITLDANNQNQLTQAIASASESLSSPNFTIGNNITVETNVTGLILDKTKFKSAEITCDIYRKTASLEKNSIFKLNCIYKPIENKWKMIPSELFDESGVEFILDESTGQVKFKSSNLAGGTYIGILRYKISRINLN